jgi:hypothetical protein
VAVAAVGKEELVARRREIAGSEKMRKRGQVWTGEEDEKTMKMHDGVGKPVAANDGLACAPNLHGPRDVTAPPSLRSVKTESRGLVGYCQQNAEPDARAGPTSKNTE